MAENLGQKRGAVKAKMTAFSKHVAGIQTKLDNNEQITDVDVLALEQRILRTEQFINEFEEIQLQIELAAIDLDKEYKEREDFEQSFYTELAKAKVILKKNCTIADVDGFTDVASVNGSTQGRHLDCIKLPTIQLPKLRGEYSSWLEFRDTFESLIHDNNNINDIQKYHYLRASLEGLAAQVIKSIELSAKTYKLAWETLSERYNNTRLLIHNHVKALFNLESIQKESSYKIRKLIDEVSKNLRSLEQLNQPIAEWDTLIVYIITTKLDSGTAREWEQYKAINEIPTLENIKAFLRSKADLLETLEMNTEKKAVKQQVNTKSFVTNNIHCSHCNKKCHFIYNCPDFLELSVDKRCARAKQLRLCLNCLRNGHFNNVCRLGPCRQCKSKHHSLLHFYNEKAEVKQSVENKNSNFSSASNTPEGASASLTACSAPEQVLLSTAYVHIFDKDQKIYTVRALLDSGSQSSIISADLCDRLKLNKFKTYIAVAGLNYIKSKIEHQCETVISSFHNAFKTNVRLLVVPEITGYVPNVKVDVRSLNIPHNLRLADPGSYKPGKVEILIGADLFWQTICVGQHGLGENKPILQKTKFGWIISGPINGQAANQTVYNGFVKNVDIQEQLTRFWELEETSTRKSLSPEEQACEEHYGRGQVRSLVAI